MLLNLFIIINCLSIITISRIRSVVNWLSIILSSYIFILSLNYCLNLNPVLLGYQLVFEIKLNILNLLIVLAIDNLSSFFILLTTFIMPFCFLYNSRTSFLLYKEYILLLFSIEILSLLLFSVTDLFWFYILYESLLLPFFLVIIVFGYRKRKNHAAYMFFFYTVFGSLFFLFSIAFLHSKFGTVDFRILSLLELTIPYQILLWSFLFLAFFVKVPVIPAHIWLPEAHVEAPTVGSVILASLLPKLSFYGFLRVLLAFSPLICVFMEPFIILIAFSSFVWSSITCLRQVDIKKIIAYSSVVHMNFATIGLLVPTVYGLSGGLVSSISHGFISGALFFSAGMLYDRFNTRNLIYYGGLTHTLPLISIYFFLFSIANFGFPGFISFIGELSITIGIVNKSFILVILMCIGLIFSTIYSMWLYDHIFNGPLNKTLVKQYDILRFEVAILSPLIFITIFYGIYPIYLLDRMLTICFALTPF